MSTARQHGFEPQLICVYANRFTVMERMRGRSGLGPGQRNDLEYGVELWFHRYSRHPVETVIENEKFGTDITLPPNPRLVAEADEEINRPDLPAPTRSPDR